MARETQRILMRDRTVMEEEGPTVEHTEAIDEDEAGDVVDKPSFKIKRGTRSIRKSQAAKRLNWAQARQNSIPVAPSENAPVETFIDGDSREVYPNSAAWFLGPKAENSELLKQLLDIAVDNHVDFRRFKHFPLDPGYVGDRIKQESSYKHAVEKMKTELGELSERLHNSVPFSNFRSQGHMLWDTTIASNVGYIAALFYNQNNVASMASGVTLQLEREVAKELCAMVGYRVCADIEHTTENPASWGHLPNGGTVANLEAMWAARCLKTNALSIRRMLDEQADALEVKEIYKQFTYKNLNGDEVLFRRASVWELLNIPIDVAIDLFDTLLDKIKAEKPKINFDVLFKQLKAYTLEEKGVLDFVGSYKKELKAARMWPFCLGKWFVPGTRHYSWDKGANILGLGRNNMVKVPVDQYCRMDIKILGLELKKCLASKVPVLGVTAVLGSTQEGAVDDLHAIIQLRNDLEKQGLTFYLHVDAAWGGYFASCLVKKPQSMMLGLSDDIERCRTASTYGRHANTLSKQRMISRGESVKSCHIIDIKLSSHFTNQLLCLPEANSITLDPHKSGFCPYPAGGLLYRNGNVRKFLAQTPAYVAHGTGNNDEINLYGIDGSKPGAASAGVWLSHKVVGLHNQGYGLLLQQCTFSAGVMYCLWASLERRQDPFMVVPGIPILPSVRAKWSNSRIRADILEAETGQLMLDNEALEFIISNGPDTLINSLAINFRYWDSEEDCWRNNSSVALQRKFTDKFYMRCSHSYERPSMVDRGIQVILNSTVWSEEHNGGAYTTMKRSLGLECDSEDIGVIINTSMSPWLRAQKTFSRMGFIIRNELYNAYGAITDTPKHLELVSPNDASDEFFNGTFFAELEAVFSSPTSSYHAVARFKFRPQELGKIKNLAKQAKDRGDPRPCPMRIRTKEKMNIFELMTGDGKEVVNKELRNRGSASSCKKGKEEITDKIKKYSEVNLDFRDIAMPEVEVTVYYTSKDGTIGELDTVMKLGGVLRYQHLGRDFVDENDYPPCQEYFLYSDDTNAYMSHCPNRWPDFQQQIQLDTIPEVQNNATCTELFGEALRRGVVVYLPQVTSGGKPRTRRSADPISPVCRDPLLTHSYSALAWTDQGAFTGKMVPITLRFYDVGRRWFNGKAINANYNKDAFPNLYRKNSTGAWLDRREDDTDTDSDDEEGL